jgi:hypothetical protein
MTINIEIPTTDEPVIASEDSLTDAPDDTEAAKTVEETKLSRLSIYVISFLAVATLGAIAGTIHISSFMFSHAKTVVDTANLTITTYYPTVNVVIFIVSVVSVALLILSMVFIINKFSAKAPDQIISFFVGFVLLGSFVAILITLISTLTIATNVNLEDNNAPRTERVAMATSVLGEDYKRARFDEGSIYVNSEGKEAYKFIQTIEDRIVTWKFTKTSE